MKIKNYDSSGEEEEEDIALEDEVEEDDDDDDDDDNDNHDQEALLQLANQLSSLHLVNHHHNKKISSSSHYQKNTPSTTKTTTEDVNHTSYSYPDLLSQLHLDHNWNLPPEIFIYTFQYLEQHDLVHKVSVLSHQFRNLIFNDRFSNLIWDFRLVRFYNSSMCHHAICRTKLFIPRRIRIKSYRSRYHLIDILKRASHRLKELRIKTVSSSYTHYHHRHGHNHGHHGHHGHRSSGSSSSSRGNHHEIDHVNSRSGSKSRGSSSSGSSSSSSSSSAAYDLEQFYQQLSLPNLTKCALYEIPAMDRELMVQILNRAPNLVDIDYIPAVDLLVHHPNWSNFKTLTAGSYGSPPSTSSAVVALDNHHQKQSPQTQIEMIRQSVLALRQLRVFDIRERLDHDILDQVMSLPHLSKVGIYCGRTLRRLQHHFSDENIGVSPCLKRVKFTKCKSVTRLLERAGSQLTHLQLFTCNPVDSRVQFQNYCNLVYLSSFKSMTISQLIQVASGCKRLRCIRFKPVYTEQQMSRSHWSSLLHALGGTEVRHLELSHIVFHHDWNSSSSSSSSSVLSSSSALIDGGAQSRSWFSMLASHLPRLVSIMLTSIQAKSTIVDTVPYECMNRLKRYEVEGNFDLGINHLQLFECTPNLRKVVFKQRDISFKQLMKLSHHCPRMKEIYIHGTIIEMEDRPSSDFRFASFERLNKALVILDGKKNTLTEVLLAAFCFYSTPYAYFTVMHPSEVWTKPDGILQSNAPDNLDHLRTLGTSLIHMFSSPSNRSALEFQLNEAIRRMNHNMPTDARPSSVIELVLTKLCPRPTQT